MEIAHKLTWCSPTNKQINKCLQLIFLINILTNIVSIFCCKCVSLPPSYEQSYEFSRALNRLNILYFEQKSLITSCLLIQLIQWRIGQNDSAHVCELNLTDRAFVCENLFFIWSHSLQTASSQIEYLLPCCWFASQLKSCWRNALMKQNYEETQKGVCDS